MSQVEEIQKLYAKPKTYKIPAEPKKGQEQVSLVITPLTLDDMDCMDIPENAPISEKKGKLKLLLAKSLGVSEEHLTKLSFEYVTELFDSIADANNLNKGDKKKINKLKQFMQKKGEQTEGLDEDGKPNRTA